MSKQRAQAAIDTARQNGVFHFKPYGGNLVWHLVTRERMPRGDFGAAPFWLVAGDIAASTHRWPVHDADDGTLRMWIS